MNMTSFERIRCTLLGNELLKSLWGEVVVSATFYVTCMEMKHKYLEVKDSKTKRDITEF